MKTRARRPHAEPSAHARGKTIGHVVKAYRSAYTGPWRMCRGERLAIRQKSPTWKGFIWVSNDALFAAVFPGIF